MRASSALTELTKAFSKTPLPTVPDYQPKQMSFEVLAVPHHRHVNIGRSIRVARAEPFESGKKLVG